MWSVGTVVLFLILCALFWDQEGTKQPAFGIVSYWELLLAKRQSSCGILPLPHSLATPAVPWWCQELEEGDWNMQGAREDLCSRGSPSRPSVLSILPYWTTKVLGSHR